jgi:hypothetical protein
VRIHRLRAELAQGAGETSRWGVAGTQGWRGLCASTGVGAESALGEAGMRQEAGVTGHLGWGATGFGTERKDGASDGG